MFSSRRPYSQAATCQLRQRVHPALSQDLFASSVGRAETTTSRTTPSFGVQGACRLSNVVVGLRAPLGTRGRREDKCLLCGMSPTSMPSQQGLSSLTTSNPIGVKATTHGNNDHVEIDDCYVIPRKSGECSTLTISRHFHGSLTIATCWAWT